MARTAVSQALARWRQRLRAGDGRAIARRSARALARRVPPRARRDRAARRASVGRGPDRAVDGGCLADQMASRARHLVLRDVPAQAARSGLQDLRRALSLPVQFLLRRRRPAPRAPAARPDHAAERRRRRRLSRPCRCGGRAADRDRAGGGRARACSKFSRSACITSSSIRNCCITDILHAFAQNPTDPVYDAGLAAAARDARPARLCRCAGRHPRPSATTATASASTTRRRATTN